jgi:putative tryptophan/tyrosine transport system substrate-binding protein
MNRRAFIAIVGGSVLAAPLGVAAQQSHAVRVGWLLPEPKSFALDPFRQELAAHGWIEGDNLIIEQRYSHSAARRYLQLASELVQLKVDALVTDGTAATKAAQLATPTIPIVFVSGDPVVRGFVATLAHPERNLTGVAIITGDLTPKRMDLLKQMIPALTRLAILEDSTVSGLAVSEASLPATWQTIEAASRQLGVQLAPRLTIRKPEQLDGAFALTVKERAGGMLIVASPFFSSQSQRIATLALSARLPIVSEHRGFVEAGGLMSYGPNHRDIFRLVAAYVDKILRGAKPGDLPVEQPTRLELVINGKTARALGLTIPQTLLLQADQVID